MAHEVSVIVPNYNKGDLVRHSLESLLKQTYGDWEAIVVDDCSGDESWRIIQDYAKKDTRIQAVRNDENKGGNYSRNRGVRMAQGKYLVFLDSDDWLEADCLERRFLEFERSENGSVDLLIFNMASTKDGNVRDAWNYGNRNAPEVSFLRHEMPWTIMMPIWRRVAFERIGGFDKTFPRLQDVELHTRALLSGVKYKFAERKSPDCFYYVDESRMTTNHAKAAETFVKACGMYVRKMCGLIQESNKSDEGKKMLMSALQETTMAAISGIGNMYQRGLLKKEERDRLYRKILEFRNGRWFVNLYAFLYKMWINKVKGFNFMYRKIIRFF